MPKRVLSTAPPALGVTAALLGRRLCHDPAARHAQAAVGGNHAALPSFQVFADDAAAARAVGRHSATRRALGARSRVPSPSAHACAVITGLSRSE